MTIEFEEQPGTGDTGPQPPERLKLLGQRPGRAVFSKPQLGVAMELTPQPYQLINPVVSPRHSAHPSLTTCNPDLIETRT
ncbi:hypothetical protein ACIBO1_18875 [Micromonospora sp. NPDC049903]|uniref:hypothetical protein n=1 Tax=Micromonospora sp. NPDC049903 TaxID=3364276 RepID=UPI0037897861